MPLLVISPYAKNGVIDHQVGEFSSVLRFIETNWGLSLLTDRDREATDLSYDFDFTKAPAPSRSAAAPRKLLRVRPVGNTALADRPGVHLGRSPEPPLLVDCEMLLWRESSMVDGVACRVRQSGER